ncbi:MAG TPA: EamA family transporter RarD [Tepidisphaeraceae bacterium]|nr:EamA family transporter RarD [Tepidisphaeraceae bacterium]
MSQAHHHSSQARAGLAYGLIAYGWWGLVPIYFKAVAHVPPLAVLAHRVVWSVVFLVVITALQRKWRDIAAISRDRRMLLTLMGSTAMVSINWLLFIYAISMNQLLQSSLAYFINPLLFVAMAVVLLKERLRAAQVIAIVIAAAGVLYMIVLGGQVPWLALGMASSFALYGLLRKVAPVSPLVGLTVETLLLLPAALGIAAWYGVHQAASGGADETTYALLAFSGVVTTVPLLTFAAAARRLPLATIGFLQYVAPTGQFLLAVFLYGEPFTRTDAICFTCIWLGLAIFSISSLHSYRARGAAGEKATAPAPAAALPE